MVRRVCVVLGLALLSGGALAEGSVAGLWKSIDDKTGKPRSLIRISENAGVLEGVIEKLIDPKEPDPKCDKCTDERKDKPVQGMKIITGLKQDGDGHANGGKILDPENGKVYDVKVKVVEAGKKLEVRGFLGVSLLGRTQVWVRDGS